MVVRAFDDGGSETRVTFLGGAVVVQQWLCDNGVSGGWAVAVTSMTLHHSSAMELALTRACSCLMSLLP